MKTGETMSLLAVLWIKSFLYGTVRADPEPGRKPTARLSM